jgi:hypothetical protein
MTARSTPWLSRRSLPITDNSAAYRRFALAWCWVRSCGPGEWGEHRPHRYRFSSPPPARM